MNGGRKPSKLILGTGMKKAPSTLHASISTSTTWSMDAILSNPNRAGQVSSSMTLYEQAKDSLQRAVLFYHVFEVTSRLDNLPITLLRELLSGISGKVGLGQLIDIEEKTSNQLARLWVEEEWNRIANSLAQDLKNCPGRKGEETGKSYYMRLKEWQDQKVCELGTKIRDAYKKDVNNVRSLKVIGPRDINNRTRQLPDPFADVRANTQLMKKAKLETISTSTRTANMTSTITKKLIPPRRKL